MPSPAFYLLPAAPHEPALIRWLGIAVDLTVVAIGVVMVVLVFLNVLFRLWGGDIAYTTELCELLMVWVTFLGGAAAARRRLHMTITEFLDKLGSKARPRADAAIGILAIMVLAQLVWYGMGIVNASWGNELTVLHVPMAVQYLGLPVGAGLTAVFVAWDLWLTLQGRSGEERCGDN